MASRNVWAIRRGECRQAGVTQASELENQVVLTRLDDLTFLGHPT